MILLYYYICVVLNAFVRTHTSCALTQSWAKCSTIESEVGPQPRRNAVRSEFTVGTTMLLGSWFGLSVGLDSSFRLLVGRRQCFTDIYTSSAKPNSATVKYVWTVKVFSFKLLLFYRF